MLGKLNVVSGRLDDPAAGNKKGVVTPCSDYKPAPYPDDVMNHRHVIVHEDLPSNVWRGSELQVYVRKVNSPSEFWINLCGLEYSRKLVTLRFNMRKFYEQADDRYFLPNYAVRFGQFCVCIYRNEWHRARIIKVDEKDRDLVDVFLVDCGGTVTVGTENLRFMHKTFAYLAIQGFRADLADIKPRSSAQWPTCVCDFFRQETSGKKFRAKLVNAFRERHSVSLKLFDVNGISISEKLLSTGMAEAVTEDTDAPNPPATRNKESVDYSADASSLEAENVVGASEGTSPSSKDDSLPKGDEAASSSSGATVSCRNVDHKYVTIAGKILLLVTITGERYFVLSEFLQAFAALHEHVVLKLLEAFPTLVAVEKMDDEEVRRLLVGLRGRSIRGTRHLTKAGVLPNVHLLPARAAGHLLTFLGEDDDNTSSVRKFVSSIC